MGVPRRGEASFSEEPRAGARYDRIGKSYGEYRRPDPRIVSLIESALGDSQSVVDVGSGTGSYEPRNRQVIAVEPSWTMIRQRPSNAAPVVRATAEHLPFPASAFDAALAVLTIHHWSDPVAGLLELARVGRRQVVLTWDPSVSRRYWLLQEYLPQILEAEVDAATLSTVEETLDVVEVTVVRVPADCTDGFLGAYWRRPRRYLDPAAREAISGIARLEESVVRRAMRQLEQDLADGTWDRRHGQLLADEQIDLGYRLVRARGRAV